ncbi:MAG: hypothetical protein M1818_005462 [Claussenomyces sp. TS43310]|nr:MAG: hypothetical protein M1818_005462 [Claussenomyces sp. TS43310]
MKPIFSRQSNPGNSVAIQSLPNQAAVTHLQATAQYIVLALDNATIYTFNPDGTYRQTLQGHTKCVWTTALYQDTLISGSVDTDMRVWSLATGRHTATVRSLKFLDAGTAVSGSRDATLRIWDLDAGVSTYTLRGHSGPIRCLAVHCGLIISGSDDATCKVWSRAGECLRTLAGHDGLVYALAVSDSPKVASGSFDGTIRIWDVQSWLCLAVLHGHGAVVSQVAMEGETLISGAVDGHVRLWSLETMGLVHDIAAHQYSVASLQVSGDRLITGGGDGCVKLWDLRTGQLIRQVGDSASAVYKVAFGAGDSIIAASKREETVLEVTPILNPLSPHALLTFDRFGSFDTILSGQGMLFTLNFSSYSH